ncbi:glycosyltransferase family 4 protein [Clostridium beijerinckii]|uniref:glycosyltransferase family 4 protein n=1 Tax=Clostridium beijerinckii TaxID=1520 RepID=UPI0014943FD2|nr:glycosyltransferase family 4 protein [Clostridium beijerinckii]NOW06485.1 glycosyltransferase involved in cell wall biosynthesis [Clostridium beijerinckii]NOW88991.1 glycosyltransferase involved in cell wall biosynthesis [Clostridium beijerinckii]NYC00371.1 glycosyltransferase involved in cell wall biosynthesis [Clostridium beijerinckii]
MKICFITTTIFNLGGVQRVVSVLASELSRNNKVDVICTDRTFKVNREMYNLNSNVSIKFNSELLHKKFTNKVICKISREVNSITGILNNSVMSDLLFYGYCPNEVQDRFIKYLNTRNYDVIIGVEGYYSIVLGKISDKLNGKTIGWMHNSYNAYLNNKGKYYWKQEELFKKYIPKLNCNVVLTYDDKIRYKEKLGIDCKVIYNPLSFECNKKSSCDKKSIIFVGRLLEQQKGLDLLIEVFNIIHKKKSDWILKIVGEGPDRESLRSHIEKYNLKNNVILLGQCDNVKDHYLESSIFVSTSRWEGFGLAITEAMECGLPVVAFDNSGPKEIISKPNINGVLVGDYNINKFADEIISLIENDEKRESMALESVKRAQDFKIDNIIKQWIQIIEKQ